jgi:hypothetical protein
MLFGLVGESASARTYSVSRDNWEPSSCSEVPPILGEVVLDMGGSAAWWDGWE